MRKSARNIFLIPRAVRFVRSHAMLVVAALVACVTMVIVPPDSAYLGYFDWNTLGCLFSVLAVANAFRFAGAFDRIASLAIEHLSTPTSVVMTLVITTGMLSMVATNDLALIIMLPITLFALVKAEWGSLIAPAFVLEGLAANLCGMIMPFGNPQNLYLYSFYSIGLIDFLQTMALPFFVSAGLVLVCTFVMMRISGVQPAKINLIDGQSTKQREEQSARRSNKQSDKYPERQPLDRRRLVAYALLLVLALLAVFRVVPVVLVVAVIFISLLAMDRTALKAVDYSLLLTFVCFFIFAGNMARMPYLGELLKSLMDANGLIAPALLSQVISNVPAAVLLSHFTESWQALLVGVNIGGAGTLIASLASLITLRFFSGARKIFPDLAKDPATKDSATKDPALSLGRFMKLFTCLNAGFLVVLLVVCHLSGV